MNLNLPEGTASASIYPNVSGKKPIANRFASVAIPSPHNAPKSELELVVFSLESLPWQNVPYSVPNDPVVKTPFVVVIIGKVAVVPI